MGEGIASAALLFVIDLEGGERGEGIASAALLLCCSATVCCSAVLVALSSVLRSALRYVFCSAFCVLRCSLHRLLPQFDRKNRNSSST